MFYKHTILAACLALTAASAHAESGTSTGTGLLTAFPGFSYGYTAHWESSAGSFQFGLTSQSSNNSVRLFNFSGSFTTTTPLLDVTSFDFVASVDLRIFNTATGLTQNPILAAAAIGSTATGYAAVSSGEQFRFSNSVISTNSSLAGPGNVASLTPTYTTSTHFSPGHYAIASSDPNCASVSCMGVVQDKLAITNAGSFFYQVQPIPEPTTAALMLAGIAAVSVFAARRRASAIAAPREAFRAGDL